MAKYEKIDPATLWRGALEPAKITYPRERRIALVLTHRNSVIDLDAGTVIEEAGADTVDAWLQFLEVSALGRLVIE